MRNTCLWTALLPAVVLVSAAFTYGQSASARPDQSGTLNMVMEEKQTNPYRESQEDAVRTLRALVGKIAELKGGTVTPVERPKDASVHFLTGVYLYCTVTKGPCPEILDSLLEIDLINSRISRKAECPTSLTFWKDWKANDMEARQKFLVRIGLLGITDDFSRNVRPGYIKCRETIAKQIEGGNSDAEYFRQRYSSPSSPEPSIKKGSDYVQAIAGSIPDVFAALQNMKK